eukprot:757797-Hanusia_phi.AAC.1
MILLFPQNIILQRGFEDTGEENAAGEIHEEEIVKGEQGQAAEEKEKEGEGEEEEEEERYEENKEMKAELEVRRSRVESIHGELEEYVSYLHSKKLEEEDEPLVSFPDNYAEVKRDGGGEAGAGRRKSVGPWS